MFSLMANCCSWLKRWQEPLFMQYAEVEMDNYHKYNDKNKLTCDNN
uniref:Uncharacterized protein n=1 Tax=Poecilia mexicana TaxID=48701 RepID=A0A3B3XQB9_9TELE